MLAARHTLEHRLRPIARRGARQDELVLDETAPAVETVPVEQAVERCQQADSARRVEQTPIRRYGAALSAVAVAAVLAVMFGPAFFRSALSAILLVQRDVEAAAPYRIQVTPGNANVPKGADQSVTATLVGFEAADATLMVRKNPTAAFESMPLVL